MMRFSLDARATTYNLGRISLFNCPARGLPGSPEQNRGRAFFENGVFGCGEREM
jgi:hypothetical protein